MHHFWKKVYHCQDSSFTLGNQKSREISAGMGKGCRSPLGDEEEVLLGQVATYSLPPSPKTSAWSQASSALNPRITSNQGSVSPVKNLHVLMLMQAGALFLQGVSDCFWVGRVPTGHIVQTELRMRTQTHDSKRKKGLFQPDKGSKVQQKQMVQLKITELQEYLIKRVYKKITATQEKNTWKECKQKDHSNAGKKSRSKFQQKSQLS